MENKIKELEEKLLRKEQECEELKEQLTMLDDEAVVVEITVEQFEEYKKLKVENEKLKEEKQGLIKDWEEKKNLGYEIACKNEKLKAENGELKEINSQLMKYRKHSVTCQECYMDGLEDGKLYNKELHKYKQALAEIKEIAEHCMEQDICTFCDYNDKCYKGFEDEALSYDVCKLILQKISEVEDVENN